MTATVPASRLSATLLLLAALAGPAGAQQPPQPPQQQSPAADPLAPRAPLPAPMILRFPSPTETQGREIGIEEAVAIALANQPTIQARAADYVAAQQRVAQALSPLLPQISGLWNGFQTKIAHR